MRITNQSEYAIRAIVEISKDPQAVYTPASLYEKIEVPKIFLAKILQKLAKKGILSSSRGTKGGFRLGKKLEEITILDIVEAVDGKFELNKCLLDSYDCSRKPRCPVHPIWAEAQETLKKVLSQKSFADIIGER